ncbi:hypothetical protein F4553_007937 [Allocatelliglobosispora scoriae]|uniref:Uncharacterized protein n=1 Tax=Allocatelliglobosispora scoriae TaxID=643052 RepID=A0A841C5U6_9ACTN|nr:hypothetical protein [Allocatelliglobosispora scoriae]MBB5874503.1 hypothetical protein [Allocatelliglobosispora scoriae]
MSEETPNPVQQVTTRAERRAAAAAKRAADSATAPKAAKRKQGSGRWGMLVFLGIAALIAFYVLLGRDSRSAIMQTACVVTGCTSGGMAAAGWLVISLPMLYLAGWSLIGWNLAAVVKPGWLRIGYALLGVPLFLQVLLFVPGKHTDLDDILAGPGSDQMATGIRWAGIGIGIGIVLVLATSVVSKGRTSPLLPVGLAVLAVLAALPVAITRADPTYYRAADAFPDTTITASGDVLQRVDRDEFDGCAGVFAADSLLEYRHCIRTVTATYTTDDSDALVTLRAVLYGSDDAAREVRDGIGAVTPLGVNGPVRSVFSVAHSWVLVGTSGHADGRAIAEGEPGWLLWALKQATYRFLSIQAGFHIDPEPKDGIAPRTP